MIANCTLWEHNQNTVVFCSEMGAFVLIPLKHLYLPLLFKATAAT